VHLFIYISAKGDVPSLFAHLSSNREYKLINNITNYKLVSERKKNIFSTTSKKGCLAICIISMENARY